MTGFSSPVTPAVRIKPGAVISRLPSRKLRTRNSQSTGDAAVLVEWHAMTPRQRATNWGLLVEWVVWLHDRYELSKETRLPTCWPQHPGIVEELWALRAWRQAVYSNESQESGEVSAGAGQAARYWHGELRQVLSAIAQQYAPQCRAGHRPAALLSTTDSSLAAQWRDADPLAGIEPTFIHASTEQSNGDAMTDDAMTHALARGTAKPLSQLVTDYLHYRGLWWTKNSEGWIAVTDPDLAAELDGSAARLRAADDAVAATQQLATGSQSARGNGKEPV